MNKPWVKRTRRRRKLAIRANKRKLDKANALRGFISPLYVDDGRVRNAKMGSRYWKNQANRKVRRSDVGCRGNYRKAYDYWWTIT